ncbi:MAG: hypothetical protein IJH45_01515 [Firmicutes bacterium]|nr:hypothetical protein [Bacillota bacterium]
MNSLNALGCFMRYCNGYVGLDDAVTEESFQAGMRVILSADNARFAACRDTKDILVAIHWPNPR